MLRFRGLNLALSICLCILLFQNCTFSHFAPKDAGPAFSSVRSNDGQVFDGKLRILHHIVDNYTCEGHNAPESILMRDENLAWHWIKNVPAKCGSEEKIVTAGVVFDDATKVAVFDGLQYLPPKPYFVVASEDPNLGDANPFDGICADANGKCSLRAAVEQAAPTALTTPVIVNVPAGTYPLSAELNIWLLSKDVFGVTVRGEGATNTILDGGGKSIHFYVRSVTAAPVSIEKMTLQNGLDTQAVRGSSIEIGPSFYGDPDHSYIDSNVSISDCIVQNNSNGVAIFAHDGSGTLQIYRSKILNNDNHGVQLEASKGLLIEDSFFSKNNSRAVVVEKNVAAVSIRNSTFLQNYEGVNFFDCKNCVIENSTFVANATNGLMVATSTAGVTDPSLNVQIRQATFYNNATQANPLHLLSSNLSISFANPANAVVMTNSILAIPSTGTQPNCMKGLNGNIQASYNLVTDATCSLMGLGNITGDPLLAPLADNGGPTLTMLLQAGSPALNAGPGALCTPTDQRGVARGGTAQSCDLGAVEMP